jgi:hypothetical protein
MVLKDKCVVHQLPDFLCRGRGIDAEELIQRLAGGRVVGRGTDPADLLGQGRHFFGGSSLAELLEPLEIRDL